MPIPVVLSRCVALAAIFVLAACAREPSDPPRTLVLKDCRLPGIESAALCGTHEVWEDRATRTGRKILVRVAILPAKRRARDPDPIVILAGGPGQGAISLADQVLPLFARLNDSRDLVFVDQRGTGGSNALDCEEHDGGSVQSVFEDALPEKLVRECLRSLDADPRKYVTTIAMQDLDEVLGGLGYAKVNLWGGSYGTRAALEFMRRHPQRVRSAILDGVAPAGMKLPLSFVGDGDAALEKLLADCAAQPLCAKAYPTLRQDISALRSKLARRPVRALIQDPVTGEREEVRVTENVLLSGLFRPLYSPELSSLLPLGIVAAADGDFNPLLAQNLEFAGDVADNLSIGMHLSVICSEDVPRITPGDLASISNSFFGRSLVDDFLGACKIWPRGEVPADYYEPVRSDAPVLILSGGIDPATPPHHAEIVAATLPNARHLVAPYLGHGVSMHGCAPRLIERFVRAGSGTEIDAACLARIPRPSFVLPLGDYSVIHAEALAKHFGAVQAVRDVTFAAGDGRVTGLLGPNGAGKTTTLRMISTLVVPDSGRIVVDGVDTQADALGVRARLGILSDARGLYGRLTARENIMYYGRLRGMDGDAIAASIDRLAALLDLGGILERRTDGFSQGERMKVAIARALVHDPRNVVLDEPTNGLDVLTTRSLRDAVRQLREAGKCVLFSSHVMQEVAALCDEIVIVARGAVVAHGPPEAILAASGRSNLEDAFVQLTGGEVAA